MELQELHKKLQNHLNEQKNNWQSFIYAQEKGFYQGFDEININGCRSTEKRYANYCIEKYLKNDKSALDIGCNCGFFSLFVSRFLKHVDSVEINPHLVDIGNDVKDYLQIHNIQFHNFSFEDFQTDKQFDIVFSFANDSTIDGNTTFTFYEYIDKIKNLMSDDGLLIFESQAEDVLDEEKFIPKYEYLQKQFKIIDERIIDSEYPVNVPTRFFLILQKIP